MLLLKPSEDEIRQFIKAQSKLPFSYMEVGATHEGVQPVGYPINHFRGKLGTGREAFDQAVAALRSWEMYNLSWTTLYYPETPVKAGEVVAVLARHPGFWSLNACRIIYSLEEEGETYRNGFAFGTLPGHVEEGEERFTVEWERETDAVWYELFAFARPKLWLAKLGSPLVRLIQRQFARDSFDAIKHAVSQYRRKARMKAEG